MRGPSEEAVQEEGRPQQGSTGKGMPPERGGGETWVGSLALLQGRHVTVTVTLFLVS